MDYLPILFFLYDYIFLFSDFFFYLQIVFSLLFSLVIAFMSDALNAVLEKAPVLSRNASFRREFQELVSWTNFVCN